MKPLISTVSRAAFVSLCLSLLLGCDSQKSPIPLTSVTGAVKYKGQPLSKGTITFMPVGGTNTSTGDIVEGKYSLSTFAPGDGAPPGEYKVAVTAWETEPGMGTEGVPAIPKKYLNADQSGLTATVNSSGSQTIDFGLTD